MSRLSTEYGCTIRGRLYARATVCCGLAVDFAWQQLATTNPSQIRINVLMCIRPEAKVRPTHRQRVMGVPIAIKIEISLPWLRGAQDLLVAGGVRPLLVCGTSALCLILHSWPTDLKMLPRVSVYSSHVNRPQPSSSCCICPCFSFLDVHSASSLAGMPPISCRQYCRSSM